MPRILPENFDRDAAEEGNAAHWFAQQLFNGALLMTGQRAPNGIALTDEMMEHVRDYIAALDCGEMEINTSYSGDEWSVNGRADHINFRDGRLTVDDFKYGWRIVEPENNWTLISHAVGWTIRSGSIPEQITLRIHQPRPYHPSGPLREWSFGYDELLKFHAKIAARLSNPEDILVSGADHCRKCHALPGCPAARQASMNAIDATTMVFDDKLDRDILAFEFETLDIAQATIKNRIEALQELMIHRIRSGEVFDGYMVEPRYANRKWKTGFDGTILSVMTGVDLMKAGTVTPAEAERRGVPKEAIAALTDRPMVGEKLQQINADRKARKIFN